MHTSTLTYESLCEIKIKLDIHGHEEEINAIVDTGFTAGTGFGLKIPTSFSQHADYVGVGEVTMANGETIEVEYIPDGKILSFEDIALKDEVTVPVVLLDGPNCIGVLVLQKYVLRFNGPEETATIEFENKINKVSE